MSDVTGGEDLSQIEETDLEQPEEQDFEGDDEDEAAEEVDS